VLDDQYFFKSYGPTPLSFYLTLNLRTLCDDRRPLNALGYRTADMAFEAGAWLKYPASFSRLQRQDIGSAWNTSDHFVARWMFSDGL